MKKHTAYDTAQELFKKNDELRAENARLRQERDEAREALTKLMQWTEAGDDDVYAITLSGDDIAYFKSRLTASHTGLGD